MANKAAEKVVLITGCSSGIGLATAVLLANDANKQFKVYATMRNLDKRDALEKEAGDRLGQTLFVKQLDVTLDEHIKNVVDEIIKEEGRIDILVNNAGFALFGPIESQAADQVKSLFATNVFGPINLTKMLVPMWKKNNSGQLIMVSSVGGLIGFPFNSVYCASKFALEGFSESMAAECLQYDIKVSLIEPGPVLTKFTENVNPGSSLKSGNLENVDDATKELLKTFREKLTARFTTMAQTSEEIAACILDAIRSPKPNLRYQTDKLYSTAIEQKLKDPSGNDNLAFVKNIM